MYTWHNKSGMFTIICPWTVVNDESSVIVLGQWPLRVRGVLRLRGWVMTSLWRISHVRNLYAEIFGTGISILSLHHMETYAGIIFFYCNEN